MPLPIRARFFCAALSAVFGFAGPANAMYTITVSQSGGQQRHHLYRSVGRVHH
jgi:hypothetical protein